MIPDYFKTIYAKIYAEYIEICSFTDYYVLIIFLHYHPSSMLAFVYKFRVGLQRDLNIQYTQDSVRR